MLMQPNKTESILKVMTIPLKQDHLRWKGILGDRMFNLKLDKSN